MTRLGQALTVVLALLGGALGAILVVAGLLVFSKLPDRIPAPHVIPKASGGTPLALAMIDDILCERFDRPGPAWYAARNRRRQAALEAERPKLKAGELPSFEFLANLDDLSAGYDLMGEAAKGIPIMEEKLARMQPVEKAWIERQIEAAAQANSDVNDEGHDETGPRPNRGELNEQTLALYRTYANLGTHLIHAYFAAAMRGDREARQRASEGLTYLKLAVAINPDAHFGRETWQIIAAEFFLAAVDRPDLLTTYDIVGNRWLSGPPPQDARPNKSTWPSTYAGLDSPLPLMQHLRRPDAIDDALELKVRDALREEITSTGAEGTWKTEFLTSLESPVPFDEPVLGILGMWTLGGGASPHFSLAIAGICERIGESQTAWRAYERAAMLAPRFSPDAALQAKLRAHCEARQSALEPLIKTETAGNKKVLLRAAFQRELKQGQDRRADRQKFEEEQFAKGADPDAVDFYKAWSLANPSIHTAPAHLDLVESESAPRRSTLDIAAGAILLAGAGALLGQLIARYALRA